VLDGSIFDEPSTRRAAEVLGGWEARRPVLVLLGAEEEVCAKSFRNMARTNVLAAVDAGVVDVAGAASVVITEAALEEMVKQASR
jgi:ribosomal protein L4